MIIETLDKMLMTYYSLNMKVPTEISMNTPVIKIKFEKELNLSMRVDYNNSCTYRGISMTFSTREKFISLQIR